MSKRPRFKVATCSGFTIYPWSGQQPTHAKPGLTASVLDTANIHREVARYRSEQRFHSGHTLGREGALRLAQAHAERLNAEYA